MITHRVACSGLSTPEPQSQEGCTPSNTSLECDTFTNTEEHANSHAWQCRCQHQRPTRDARGQRRMRPCGSSSCSRQCRDTWGWKRALCLARSFRTHPPKFFVTLRTKLHRTGKQVANDIGRLMARLRKLLTPSLEYARVFEWRNGRIHAHLLLNGIEENPGPTLREALETRHPGIYEATCTPVRDVDGVARYVVKDTNKQHKRAELTPTNFSGRVIQFSKGFLSKPIKALWRDIQADRREQTQNEASNSTDTAPLPHHIVFLQPLRKAA